MSETYELREMSDMLKIPHDRIGAFVRDLQYALEMAHFTLGEESERAAFNVFVWTDDGSHSVDVSVNDEPLCRLEVTG